jgi:Tol biopolymer transport system component
VLVSCDNADIGAKVVRELHRPSGVLAVMPGQIYNPASSPDGRHIFFTSARRSHELWVMRDFLPQLQAAR